MKEDKSLVQYAVASSGTQTPLCYVSGDEAFSKGTAHFVLRNSVLIACKTHSTMLHCANDRFHEAHSKDSFRNLTHDMEFISILSAYFH